MRQTLHKLCNAMTVTITGRVGMVCEERRVRFEIEGTDDQRNAPKSVDS